jgi:hypothetical protein
MVEAEVLFIGAGPAGMSVHSFIGVNPEKSREPGAIKSRHGEVARAPGVTGRTKSATRPLAFGTLANRRVRETAIRTATFNYSVMVAESSE